MEFLRQVWGEVGPGVDEKGPVEAVDHQGLVGVQEQPEVGRDTWFAVARIEHPAVRAVPHRERGETVVGVEAPELVGDDVPRVAHLKFMESHARGESEVEVECVQDALGDRQGR